MTDETKKPAGKRAKSSTARGAGRRSKVNVPTDEDALRLLVQLVDARVWAVANKIIDEMGERYDAAVAAGKRDPRCVVFNGWSGLADALGAPRDAHAYSMIQEVLDGGCRASWELPGVKGIGLWTYTATPWSEPGRQEVVVVLGDALAPAAVVPTVKSRRDL
jgi:hypothetical protein